MTDLNTQSASITGLVGTKHPNKGFGTGKGTTAKIRDLFNDNPSGYTVAEAAERIGVPARQLNKRFAELVKSGFLAKDGTHNGRNDYRKAA